MSLLDVASRSLFTHVRRHGGGHGGDDEDALPWDPSQHGPDVVVPAAIKKAATAGREPWMEMPKYQRWTTYLLAAIVALVVLPGLLHRLRVHRPKSAASLVKRLPGYFLVASMLRSVGYVSLGRPRGTWGNLPTLGPLLSIVAFSITLFVWCLAVMPWYRPSREYGSPPLAIRAGMFSNALLPWVYALATKINPLTIITALSHERLQLYHQWTARLALLFGLIHSVPFILQPLRDGGSANLWAYWKSDACNWSGAVCLALMAWLVASGTRVFRNASYEFFVVNHIFTVLLFTGFYYFHIGDLLQAYIWFSAGVASWGLSWVLRTLRAAAASRFFVNHRASVEVAVGSAGADDEDAMVRIAMRTPVRWSPGQHVFVRFPTISPLQAHPFTAVTLPSPLRNADNTLVLVARVKGGLTRHLYDRVKEDAISSEGVGSSPLPDVEKALLDDEKSAAGLTTHAALVPAVLDGPYGASSAALASFDSVLIIAGGSGVTFAMPTLAELSRGAGVAREVHLVWSVRSQAIVAWFQPQLDALKLAYADEANAPKLRISIHVTRQSVPDDASWTPSRPDVASEMATAKEEADAAGLSSLAVCVCGPRGMSEAASNEAARLQRRLTASVKEVYLLNESFGW